MVPFSQKLYFCNRNWDKMQSNGQVIIHIEGKYGAEPLTPENYDITLMREVLDYAFDLLDIEKKKDRPVVTFHTTSGSVNNVFTVSRQKAVEFASIISLFLSSLQPLDILEPKTAIAIEGLQKFAIQNNFSLGIHSSEATDKILQITPETDFHRTESLWVDAEIYYYGTLTDAGGKGKPNIHLDTKDGLIKIDVDKEYLANYHGNPLYRKFGVIATAKQNIMTGAIDSSSLKLKELVEFEPKFDMEYLKGKIAASTPVWSGVDVDNFLKEIRGGVS